MPARLPCSPSFRADGPGRRGFVSGAFAEAGLLWTATLVAFDLIRRRSRPALGGALALLTAVPIVASRRIAYTLNEEEVFSRTRFAHFLERMDPRGSYRTFGESAYS